MKLKINEVAYHRNGVCGAPFWAVRFRWRPDGESQEENFIAVLFDEPGRCAVLGLDRMDTMGVAFAGGNSWRGDRFEGELRRAIEDPARHSGGVPMGPFCIPTERRVETDE